jgi:hypothetical protein
MPCAVKNRCPRFQCPVLQSRTNLAPRSSFSPQHLVVQSIMPSDLGAKYRQNLARRSLGFGTEVGRALHTEIHKIPAIHGDQPCAIAPDREADWPKAHKLWPLRGFFRRRGFRTNSNGQIPRPVFHSGHLGDEKNQPVGRGRPKGLPGGFLAPLAKIHMGNTKGCQPLIMAPWGVQNLTMRTALVKRRDKSIDARTVRT